MINHSQIKTGLLMASLSFLLIGCGATKTPVLGGQSELPSRPTPLDDTFDPNSTGSVDHGLLSECNEVDGEQFNFNAALATYYDPSNGLFVPDRIQMKVNTTPSELTSGETIYIKFYRWYQNDGEAQPTVSPTPVSFFFVERGTGELLFDDAPISTLSRNTIQSVISEYDLGSKSVTMTNFFQKYYLILTGMDIQYDAITTALYDADQGTSAQAKTNSLIPAFSSDPNIYKANHSAQALQVIHPLYDRINSGLSEYQFSQEAQKLCDPFFQ